MSFIRWTSDGKLIINGDNAIVLLKSDEKIMDFAPVQQLDNIKCVSVENIKHYNVSSERTFLDKCRIILKLIKWILKS